MKKRMLALLLGLLCAGLTACGSTDTAAKDETPSAPTVEQPEPEPTPEEVRRTAAEQYADDLTLEEQVAQMFFVRCPETDAAVLAVQAGNDMLTSSDFETQYNAVLAAVQDGTIPESQIHASAVRVIDWKMQLGLISYNA